jgi:hypothetical protein
MIYYIKTQKTKLTFVATYNGGLLKSLEIKKGKLDVKLWQFLPFVIPYQESDMEAYSAKFDGRIEFKQVQKVEKNQSFYSKFVQAWFHFYFEISGGLEPKFAKTEGKAMKEIAAYLLTQSSSEEEAVNTWEHLLKSWKKLDKFTQSKPELTYINSKLSSILIQLKNGNAANDIRQSL